MLPRFVDCSRTVPCTALLFAIACASPPPASTPIAAGTASTAKTSTIADAGEAWWAFVGTPSEKDEARALKALDARLRQLPPEQVLQIHRAFFHEFTRSYRWDLWGAAYLMNGGCSDDCFDYFRGWLLLQGQTVFEDALRNPDSSLTHQEPPNDSAFPELGKGWDFGDPKEMQPRYPKLSARFAR